MLANQQTCRQEHKKAGARHAASDVPTHLVNVECVGVIVLPIVRLISEPPHPGVRRLSLMPPTIQRSRAIVLPSIFCKVWQYLQEQSGTNHHAQYYAYQCTTRLRGMTDSKH